jgi:hypothetical protein
MKRVAWLCLVVFQVAACGVLGSSSADLPTSPPRPPAATTPSPEPDPVAVTFARTNLNLLLAGASAPPSILTWEDVLTGKKLTSTQSTAFCGALGIQGADNAIASILAAGLNALSLRLHKRPLTSEAEDLIGYAATFVTATCRSWDPTRRPIATPPPITRWYPRGYTPMIFQPDVAWLWADPRTEQFSCDGPSACYGLHVVTRAGCPGTLRGTIATKDPNGVVLEVIQDSKTGTSEDGTLLVFDMTNTDATAADIIAVSCDA